MTRVRHETVHYTAEEMAAKEAADAVAKAKKRKTRLIICGVSTLVIVFSCITCLALGVLAPDVTPTPIAIATATYAWPEPETVGPISTARPAPTSTPTYTHQSATVPILTPRPTRTPQPTALPTPLPEVEVLTGSGDAVLDVTFEVGCFLHIVGNAASRHFAVESYDGNNKQINLLVNTTDPYDGFRPIDILEGEDTKRILITATGEWTIWIIPLAPVPELLEHVLEIPGTYEGVGDDVIWLVGEPDIAMIQGNAEGRYFGVFSMDRRKRLLINTTDPYEGNHLLESGTWLLEVRAEGSWSITVTGR